VEHHYGIYRGGPIYWTHGFGHVCGFLAGGQYIVSGSQGRKIRVWNVTTGETAASVFIGHVDSVESVAFSPDYQCIVSSGDESIRMLNVTTGKTETTGHLDFTDHSVINEEGRICGSKGELIMWVPPPHTREHPPK